MNDFYLGMAFGVVATIAVATLISIAWFTFTGTRG